MFVFNLQIRIGPMRSCHREILIPVKLQPKRSHSIKFINIIYPVMQILQGKNLYSLCDSQDYYDKYILLLNLAFNNQAKKYDF